jgi:hypothetical protein
MHPDKLLTAAKPAARFDSFFFLYLALIVGRILKASGSSFYHCAYHTEKYGYSYDEP